MSGLLKLLSDLPDFEKLSENAQNGTLKAAVTGILSGQKAHLFAGLCQKQRMPGFFIVADDHEAKEAVLDLSAVLGEGVYHYPSRDMLFYQTEGHSYEWEHERIKTICAVLSGRAVCVVGTIDAVLQFACCKARFISAFFTVEEGQTLSPDDFCQKLIAAGYTRTDVIEGKGQFSRRGGIVDFFAPHEEKPFRIEFFGDEIDTIAPFEIESQRRRERVKLANVSPACEVLINEEDRERLIGLIKKQQNSFSKKEGAKKLLSTLSSDLERLQQGLPVSLDRYLFGIYPKPSCILDYFPKGFILAFSETRAIKEAVKTFEKRWGYDIEILLERGLLSPDFTKYYFSYHELLKILHGKNTVCLDMFPPTKYDMEMNQLVSFHSHQISSFTADTKELLFQLKDFAAKGYKVLILCASKDRGMRLSKTLLKEGIQAPFSEDMVPEKGQAVIAQGSLRSGMEYPQIPAAVLCENVRTRQIKKKEPAGKFSDQAKEKLKSYADLKVGDYIVHVNYGIGVFEGIEKISYENVTKDYIKIRYAGQDNLYVPCNQLDMISKYIAPQSSRLKLSKMGGGDWAKTKARVKESAKELAKELIELYAKRAKVKGFAFPPEDDLQADFESRFEYEETKDQLKSVEEIKKDMEQPVPMDRLLCGDVGVGKTEVALRAIFKCLRGGKQAAILVPTTLLANQHFATINERFSDFPVSVALLSRLKSKKEQDKIVSDIKKGLCDIVIGTHRLLSKDISFAKLGLLVVDEEQRFGVSHKEKLKAFTKSVDVLTLSATPIPRTLNMALSGIRDMSTIEEPPAGRMPVVTYVIEQSDDVVADAIRKEMRRGGQVYYLHNRTETIQKTAANLKKLVPEANIITAHGQMDQDALLNVMTSFIAGEGDVLVCTTIIETGIDIPNVNTLVIENADKLGLAQLYQIRGRVGRSLRKAYAYLMYGKTRIMTPEASKRLLAIREFTEFGSGFKIALRDLEIRGAGSLLGTKQHGHIETVGYDMYLKLLSQAVAEQKGEPEENEISCMLDLFISAYIPDSYVKSPQIRIDFYKKISAVSTEEDGRDVKDELIDRFGDIPDVVLSLIDIALLRNRAGQKGIVEINQRQGYLVFVPSALSTDEIMNLSNTFKGNISFNPLPKESFSIRVGRKNTGNVMEIIQKVLANIGLQKQGNLL